ncbi:MAG TPA: SPOR domain-containing protein [Candidatus Acidoferrales bacterium]|nr:SPOR domain-containing protein [Candidatus Acidoferrales bacterium]
MAGRGQRGGGGGDRVLESRHLVGLFLGVVLLCGVFFTLGYVMGRNQFGGPVHAEEKRADDKRAEDKRVREIPPAAPAATKSKQSDPAPSSASGDWDFYGKSSPKNPDTADEAAAETRNGATSSPAAKTKPVASTTPSGRFQPPKMAKSSIVLQVSALTRQSDALAMADAIQQKGFPSFVVTPTTDNFYRVQVGPYADEKSADVSKRALEQAGFKSIIKR